MIYLHVRSISLVPIVDIERRNDYGKRFCRGKGKKWYYRYYMEDASGNLVQKECVGTESKSETEKLLRKAMEEYESRKVVAKTENITLGELLDVQELLGHSAVSTAMNIYALATREAKKNSARLLDKVVGND